jgi:hypothetical protein
VDQTQRVSRSGDAGDGAMTDLRYAELQATSHFSFLRGASSCEELFGQAAACGIEAVAVCDHNTVAGIVRAHEAAKLTGVRLIVGCRLDLTDGTGILVYPLDRTGYGRLCRLLSLGKSRAGKGQCRIDWTDLAHYSEGLIAVLTAIEADCRAVTGLATPCACTRCPTWRPPPASRRLSPTTCCFMRLPVSRCRTSWPAPA